MGNHTLAGGWDTIPQWRVGKSFLSRGYWETISHQEAEKSFPIGATGKTFPNGGLGLEIHLPKNFGYHIPVGVTAKPFTTGGLDCFPVRVWEVISQ